MFRLSVRPQVLIPEGPRDLVIALETGDHEELLEQLRRLRQRVELSGLQPARDQEVASSLRRAFGQYRRLDIHEAPFAQIVAHRAHHLMSEHQVAQHAGAPQVDIAVPEAQSLVDVDIVFDEERRRLGCGEYLQIRGDDFHLACGQVRVDAFGGPGDDLAGDRDHIFAP